MHSTNNPTSLLANEEKIINFNPATDQNTFRFYSDYFNTNKQHILQFLSNNPVYSEIITNTALIDIFNSLNSLLNEYTIKFINHDIKNYVNDLKSKNFFNINEISIEQSVEELTKYYSLNRDIKVLYPAFDNVLTKISLDFVNQCELLIQRICNDIDIISKGFNPEYKSDNQNRIQLNHIISSGSDTHHQGAQVLILEFHNYNQSFKLVYKPSSVEADAFITGNMRRLKLIEPQWQEYRSFIEIVNQKLELQNICLLPTYLIIPKYDQNNNNIIFCKYGYIEYIQHKPWETLDLTNDFKNLLSKTEIRDRWKISGEIEKIYNDEFNKLLVAAINDPNCSYILRTEEDQNNFSFSAGCLSAIMIALGIIDMHAENMIVSNKLPVLIDLENSFLIDDAPTISKTLVFRPDMGSFSPKSVIPKLYDELLDIHGIQTLNIEQIEKNRSFTVFQIKNGTAEPYLIDQQKAKNGINFIIDCFVEMKHEFDTWFKNVNDFNICVRYIPLSTSVFRTDLEGLLACIIKPGIDLHNEIKQFQNALSDVYDTEQAESKEANNYAIYQKSCLDAYVDELLRGNIPVYYVFVKEKELYDFNSRLLKINPINSTAVNGNEATEIKDTTPPKSFFNVSPISHIKLRFDTICSNHELTKDQLNAELASELKRLGNEVDEIKNVNAPNNSSSQPTENKENKCGCCRLM
jgi:hypothetical protein